MEVARSNREICLEFGNKTEAMAYTFVWNSLYCLKNEIERSLDEETTYDKLSKV